MKRFTITGACALALALHLPVAAAGPQAGSFPVKLEQGTDERSALVCLPKGAGPFPAVVFNHGSIVDGWGWPGAMQRGYRLDNVCEKLAEEGYFVFAPIREKSPRGKGYQMYDESYRDIVMQAIDHVKTLPEVDGARVALAGFSMGGLVSFRVASTRKDLRAVALLAPAFGRGLLAKAARQIGQIEPPLLLMIEEGDAEPIHRGVTAIEASAREAGKPLRLVRYNRGGGHELFYDTGYWWEDFASFLREHLGKP